MKPSVFYAMRSRLMGGVTAFDALRANTFKRILLSSLLVGLFIGTFVERANAETNRLGAGYGFAVGIATVDITPKEAVILAGAPSPKKTAVVGTPLFVKAMVISAGGQKVAIVTLDTLKYFTNDAVEARKLVEQTTGIPASHVIISASHTHRGPLWTYYKDRLKTPIAKAVALALNDLTPCKLGSSRGAVEGVSKNRRVLKEGDAWNTWLLKPSERKGYPPTGPIDPEVLVLAAVDENGKYKAILYNFACHATNTHDAVISADYPGDVQRYIDRHFDYSVPTLFLPGACGDINPSNKERSVVLGEGLGKEIVSILKQIEFVAASHLAIESSERKLLGRAHPEFKEKEITRKWPAQVEHYRQAFEKMRERSKPAYRCFFSAIQIGKDFAIVTNPDELFCQIGLNIKKRSPFKYTMVAEQTNGARGYIPTVKAFELGGYETWYGEHSYLGTQAGEIIEKESLVLLKLVKNKK